jgi:hypothetical protein
MNWSFEHALAAARVDSHLLDYLLVAAVCLIAHAERKTPRTVLEQSSGVRSQTMSGAIATRRRSTEEGSRFPSPRSSSSRRGQPIRIRTRVRARPMPGTPPDQSRRVLVARPALFRQMRFGPEGQGYRNQMRVSARTLAGVHAAYFVSSGVWPLLHRPSFERATGKKKDFWLVRTVGGLAAASGLSMGLAAWRGSRQPETVALRLLVGWSSLSPIFTPPEPNRASTSRTHFSRSGSHPPGSLPGSEFGNTVMPARLQRCHACGTAR